jgi:uncharacterized membrane protein
MFSFNSNADAVVIKLLKAQSIKIDPNSIRSEFEKHPDFPGLLSISDVLSSLKIKNAAYRVDNIELTKISCPFIAHTNINNGDFVVVDKIEGEDLTISSDKWNKHRLKLNEFLKLFKGVVLTTQVSEYIPVSSSYLFNLVKKVALIVAFILSFLFMIEFHSEYFVTLTGQIAFLTVFKSIGLFTAILLLVQSIDSNNPLIQKLCQSGKNTNCNAILTSSAAKVFEGLTWSEAGFFYFAGTWLLLLFGGTATIIFQFLLLLNLISLPYTFYSIYYQAFVAKQWCIFCCTVQAILWLEFFLLFSFFHSTITRPSSKELSGIFVAMLVPIIIWSFIKPLLLSKQQLQPLKQQLQKFKFNVDIFNNRLSIQPKYKQPDKDWSLVIGNPDALNVLTVVSNPYCPHCDEAHHLLDDLLKSQQNLQIRIVFTTTNEDADPRIHATRHLVALSELNNPGNLKLALNDWYSQKEKRYNLWSKRHPVNMEDKNFNIKLDKQKEWCETTDLMDTPTVLLNGYLLPEQYRLKDLKYMLD